MTTPPPDTRVESETLPICAVHLVPIDHCEALHRWNMKEACSHVLAGALAVAATEVNGRYPVAVCTNCWSQLMIETHGGKDGNKDAE